LNATRTGGTRRRALAGWLAIGLIIFVYYFGLATQFRFEPWPTTSGGFVFNSQLRSLLEGRFDIDPRIIGNEAFVREGKTYTYFGILPALLRLPLLNQLWRDWTTAFCVLAATMSSLALFAAALTAVRAADTPVTRAMSLVLAASFILSGPQVELLGKPSVYVEAILWAYASACIFLYTVLPLLFGRPASVRRLSILGACAATALLARVSTGIALYAACAALFCALAWRWHIADLAWRSRALRLLPATAFMLAAALITVTVNTQRWGRPLEFAPLASNRYYAADPSRLERLARHGVFSLARVPDALSYYVAPAWFFAAPADSTRADRVADLFDGPEGPPIGVPQAQGLWIVLALLGATAWASGRAGIAWPAGVGLIAGGLVIGPLLMTSYHYLAFRYRAEFAPLMLLFALLGLHTLRTWLPRIGTPFRAMLLALAVAASATQILQAHAARHAYACTPMGSYTAARTAALACLASADRRSRGPSATAFESGDRNPSQPPMGAGR